MVFTPYLSKDVLAGFDKYKYSSKDTSPFSNYVMHPFWDWIVPMLPTWLAPNFMTLFGFCLLVVNFFLLACYDDSFGASNARGLFIVPSWVWLVCAVNNFLSHTLDGCDGKQARRTKSSSALGELFDHGLDSWATLFLPLGMYHIFGTGSDHGLDELRMLFVLFNVMFLFIASHWEKYNTGVLFLPWSYDIAQVLMSLAFMVTCFGTYEIWKFEVPFLGIGVARVFEAIMHGQCFLFALPINLWNIYAACRAGTNKQHSLWEGTRPLVGVLVLLAATLLWAVFSPNAILFSHARVFYTMTGTLFSNITCRLIVSQMSSTRCELLNWLLLPLVVVVASALALPLSRDAEVTLLWVLAIVVVLEHIHYGCCVVKEMAAHLNIHVFSVKKPQRL